MGTSTSWSQLDAKLERFARDISDLPKTQTREATLIVEQSVSALMPSRLRGVGKKGAALRVRSETTGSGEASSGRVWVDGPAQLIENDTLAHIIVPGGARGLGASRSSRMANATSLLGAGPRLAGLRIGFGRGAVLHFGNRFAAYAHHPGTKGKHPWAKGVAAAVPIVEHTFAVPADAIMRSIF